MGEGKTKMKDHVSECKPYVWGELFKLDENPKLFQHSGNYVFNYSMSTDGVGCSLLFRHKSLPENYKEKDDPTVEKEKKTVYRLKS